MGISMIVFFKTKSDQIDPKDARIKKLTLKFSANHFCSVEKIFSVSRKA
jgi:hypothetical protein